MTKYFKTLKTSDTGKKFKNLDVNIKKAQKAQRDFSDKYNFNQWRPDRWEAFGGIEVCVDFIKEPDPKNWKMVSHGEYKPKRSTKEGKRINQEMKELPVVSHHELNMCIGFKEGAPFKSIGFSSKSKNYTVFCLATNWKVKIPSDCEEITASEYENLSTKNPKL